MHRRGFTRSKRFRGERGASLTEYALIFSVLAVGTLAATQFLGDQAAEETDQQATCVSERPPPPGCQIPTAATTTTMTVDPPPTTAPTVTQETIAPPLPGSVVVGTPPPPTGTSPGPWTIEFPVTRVQDSDGVAVEGAVVRFAIYWSNGTETVFSGTYTSCTTDANGSCTATLTQPPEDGLTIVQAQISSVTEIEPTPNYPTTPIVVTLP